MMNFIDFGLLSFFLHLEPVSSGGLEDHAPHNPC